MRRCRICGVEGDHHTHRAREMMFGFRDEFRYIECVSCGCLQISEIPQNLSRYYPGDYYSYSPGKKRSRGRFQSYLKRQRALYQLHRRGAAARLFSVFDPPREYFGWLQQARVGIQSRILDVGCGSGKFLLKLEAHGFSRLCGVDPFIAADIDYGNGVRVLKRELGEIDGEFDFILLNHSFEHVSRPLEALRQVRRLLVPGRLALLRIPVAGSFAWKTYRTDWVQMDPPRHLYLHTPRSLEILAGQAGLKIAEVVFDSTEFQFLGSEQYRMDIPLRHRDSYFDGRNRTLFSRRQIHEFKIRAEDLNRRGEGDQACFFLRHRTA